METAFQTFKPGEPTAQGRADLPAEPDFKSIRNLVAPLIGTGNIEHVTVLYLTDERPTHAERLRASRQVAGQGQLL